MNHRKGMNYEKCMNHRKGMNLEKGMNHQIVIKRLLKFFMAAAAAMTVCTGCSQTVEIMQGRPLSLSLHKSSEETEISAQLYSKSAVLIDGDSGRVLFGKNESEVLPMASTTKIMTCILALENVDIKDTAVVSEYAASMPEVSLGLKAGQTCTVENLLYSMMLESHNDAAVVIAEKVAGSAEAFAKMMNDKAKSIGCTDTFFVTPNGLDGEAADENGQMRSHSTTALDLAKILRYCMKLSEKKEDFIQITTTMSWPFTDVNNEMSKTLTNHNSFLNMMRGASSGKTGFTGKAGYCYVGSVIDGERTYIAALLACGWPDNKTYKWRDMEKLINYGKNNYEIREINTSPNLEPIDVYGAIGEINQLHDAVKIPVAVDHSVDPAPLKILLRDDEQVKITYNMIEKAEAPVTKGQMAGTVIFSIDNIKLKEYPVVFEENAQQITAKWCLRQIADRFLNP